jgi:predicted anti-sigma-YlaC factor YlaD
MTTSDHNRKEALDRVLGPSEFEVTCEQCFELLDEYVELELTGADADRQLPGVRTHFQGCPACREDYESLRDLVRSDYSG